MTDSRDRDLLAALHALEDAEKERARVAREQHSLIGQLLQAKTRDEVDRLAWKRARLNDAQAAAEMCVRDLTTALLDAVDDLHAKSE